MASIGTTIRLMRIFRHMSQEELAEKTGLTRTAIGNIERGDTKPYASSLLKIADALCTTPLDLMNGNAIKEIR